MFVVLRMTKENMELIEQKYINKEYFDESICNIELRGLVKIRFVHKKPKILKLYGTNKY